MEENLVKLTDQIMGLKGKSGYNYFFARSKLCNRHTICIFFSLFYHDKYPVHNAIKSFKYEIKIMKLIVHTHVPLQLPEPVLGTLVIVSD